MTIIGRHSCGDSPSDSGCVEIRYFASKGMSAGINRVSHKCVRGARRSCVVVNNNDYSAVFAVSLSVSTLTSLSVYGNAKTNVISILNACYQYGFLHNLTTLSLCRSASLTFVSIDCAIPESGFSQFFLSHSSRLISLQLDGSLCAGLRVSIRHYSESVLFGFYVPGRLSLAVSISAGFAAFVCRRYQGESKQRYAFVFTKWYFAPCVSRRYERLLRDLASHCVALL